MLGIDVAKSTVERYMVKRPKPASPTWRALLANHVACLASIDFLTVPTVRNRVLCVFVVLAHLRRRVLHFNVTTNPTAEWTSRQIIEAFPWDMATLYHAPAARGTPRPTGVRGARRARARGRSRPPSRGRRATPATAPSSAPASSASTGSGWTTPSARWGFQERQHGRGIGDQQQHTG